MAYRIDESSDNFEQQCNRSRENGVNLPTSSLHVGCSVVPTTPDYLLWMFETRKQSEEVQSCSLIKPTTASESDIRWDFGSSSGEIKPCTRVMSVQRNVQTTCDTRFLLIVEEIYEAVAYVYAPGNRHMHAVVGAQETCWRRG